MGRLLEGGRRMWGAEAVFYLQAEVFACGYDVLGRGLIAATGFRLLISALWFLFQKVHLTIII